MVRLATSLTPTVHVSPQKSPTGLGIPKSNLRLRLILLELSQAGLAVPKLIIAELQDLKIHNMIIVLHWNQVRNTNLVLTPSPLPS